MICPKCGAEMRMYERNGVTVDQCTGCRGVFLDRGELERLIESAVALTKSDVIELDDLPPRVRGEYGEILGNSIVEGHSMRAWGSRYARLVLERCGRNKRRACRMLDISYHTLQAYLRYADATATGSEKQLPAWVKSASQEPVMEEAGP